ncbi:phosphatase PAP2 family protein [Cohaesibacter celericrescens]|uniref:Inositolphosphotransferase Aur1/Ipt1 domain-containing protein n=1 Tax=Cohaesibacter celericrescens TaxID=2067669 RepID=A0A2N5XK80_9HYPH|nr:phosphatase PAP2 family protein [Cohaesibacter celericrescens]PLW74923.1 hypothetical protein C0081_21685 [Cohaesibacter celericrescens]
MAGLYIVIELLVSILLIVVGYKFYFLPQRFPIRGTRTPMTRLDHKIPFRPDWVWLYSGLYYPFMLSPVLFISDLNEYISLCVSFFLLLFTQIVVAFAFPVKAPTEWRNYAKHASWSTRFLAYVQRVDKGGNCFPSMHVAVAVLVALHLTQLNTIDQVTHMALLWSIPVLVAISTLYTKQHLLIDLPAGAALAAMVYWVHVTYIVAI